MTTQTTALPTQVYRVWIKSTPERIWTAITDPAWTVKYGYAAPAHFELKPGAAMRAYEGVPETIIDGEFLEVDPPRKLVQTWRMLMDPAMAEEGFTRLTHEIEELEGGVVKLTVIHELEGAPSLALMLAGGREAEGAGGGWAWVLSDLKTLLESGSHMAAS
jgi:uncharacterized protein YndB with AHSA1/START domain